MMYTLFFFDFMTRPKRYGKAYKSKVLLFRITTIVQNKIWQRRKEGKRSIKKRNMRYKKRVKWIEWNKMREQTTRSKKKEQNRKRKTRLRLIKVVQPWTPRSRCRMNVLFFSLSRVFFLSAFNGRRRDGRNKNINKRRQKA